MAEKMLIHQNYQVGRNNVWVLQELWLMNLTSSYVTSALDPQTTDEILDLLLKIKERENLTIVIITHEMHVIRRVCDEVAVMESGRVIEQGKVTQVFENPQHEVTRRFVKDDLDDDFEESIKHLEPLDSDAYIVRLNFNGGNTTEPVVSYISKTHNIDINILEANIKIPVVVLSGSWWFIFHILLKQSLRHLKKIYISNM